MNKILENNLNSRHFSLLSWFLKRNMFPRIKRSAFTWQHWWLIHNDYIHIIAIFNLELIYALKQKKNPSTESYVLPTHPKTWPAKIGVSSTLGWESRFKMASKLHSRTSDAAKRPWNHIMKNRATRLDTSKNWQSKTSWKLQLWSVGATRNCLTQQHCRNMEF